MSALMVLVLYLMRVPGIVLAFTLHEYVKAATSTALGDSAPRRDGRLTLNPIRHFEPMGFMCLFFFGLGWGKPVETRAFGYKDRKKAEIIVYTLPSVANLLIGLLCAAVVRLMSLSMHAETLATFAWQSVAQCLRSAALINVGYALFNIIPMHPLDGVRVLSAAKPETGMNIKSKERMVQVVVLLLLCMGLLGQFIGAASDAILGFMYV